MIYQERHGQLVLARVVWPFPPEDVPKMLQEQKRIQSQHNNPSVILLDARPASVVPREVADGMITALTTRRVRRIAILAAPKFIAEMQLERILRTAQQENGRVFTEPGPAQVWLSELLTPEEKKLLEDFLREPSTAPSPSLGT